MNYTGIQVTFINVRDSPMFSVTHDICSSAREVKVQTRSAQTLIYRVIHKSLRGFRTLRYSSRDGHAEGEYVNRRRDTQISSPTLQVLDMSTLGDAAYVNPVIKFLLHTLQVCGRDLIIGFTSAALPRLDISSACKVGQKLGDCLSQC